MQAQDAATLVQNLYLLAATPTPSEYAAYPAELYGFSPAGKPVPILTITEGGTPVAQRGVRFIRFDDDGRFIVIATPFFRPNVLTLIRMDAPETPVTAPIAIPDKGAPWLPWPKGYTPGSGVLGTKGFDPSAVDGRLLESSGARSLMISWLDDLRGTINTIIPIGVSGFGPSRTAADEDRNLRMMTGQFGLYQPLQEGDAYGTRILNGRLVLNGMGGKPFDIGLATPPLPESLASATNFGLVIRNPRMNVLSADEGRGAKERTLFVWTTTKGRWERYRVPGESWPVIRPCENWILGVAAFPARDVQPDHTVVKRKQESPGAADRLAVAKNSKEESYKAASGKLRPNPHHRLAGSEYTYPGVLYAIDTETGRFIQFNTDQGDSEPLAVRNDVLYYRVNNRLYARKISGTIVGPAILLAEHEAIPEVHWAFFRR